MEAKVLDKLDVMAEQLEKLQNDVNKNKNSVQEVKNNQINNNKWTY